MTATRADYLQKRLTSEGLGTDAIQAYIQVLRQFLTAKMTKVAFEAAISKVLPKDKFSVHNSIIMELLQRAQQKREGHPDVPVIQPVKEKRNTGTKSGALRRKNSSADKHPTGNKRRKLDKDTNGVSRGANKKPPVALKNNGNSNINSNININSNNNININSNSNSNTIPNKDVGSEEPAHPKPTPKIDSNNNAHGDMPVRNELAVPPAEIPTYDTLSFQPVRPGQAIDIELFRKIKARMCARVEARAVAGGVKDESVALMTHALEIHIKHVMESAVRNRTHREDETYGAGNRNHNYGNYGNYGSRGYSRFRERKPVAAHDLREGCLRDIEQLGNDPGEALERLSLLL